VREAERGEEALAHIGAALPRGPGVDVLCAQLRDMAARQDRSFLERPVLLGHGCDPWQPAERELGLTRKVLEGLAALPGVDLRCTTQSSLVGRDLDLLGQIARRGRVQVRVSVTSLERRAWTALEPHAPSPERRLMAMGMLARAGIAVGVQVEPVLRGVHDAEAAWVQLLTRAREAGAGFATARPLALSDGARERLLRHLGEVEPERVAPLRRLLARPHLHDARSWAEAQARFAAICKRVGLECRDLSSAEAKGEGGPRQLSLF
jgi:DNA repair photolyase